MKNIDIFDMLEIEHVFCWAIVEGYLSNMAKTKGGVGCTLSANRDFVSNQFCECRFRFEGF
jgi:hypothetical protein